MKGWITSSNYQLVIVGLKVHCEVQNYLDNIVDYSDYKQYWTHTHDIFHSFEIEFII